MLSWPFRPRKCKPGLSFAWARADIGSTVTMSEQWPKHYHRLTALEGGVGVSWITGGTGENLGSGVPKDSGAGVATGSGTSNPGLMEDAELVFSTGGSSYGEALGLGSSGTWVLVEGRADAVSRIKGRPLWAPITMTLAFADFERSRVASIPFHRRKLGEIPGVTIF